MGEPCENEVQILRNELVALRNRIEYLEKLLLLNEPPAESNRNMCTFCQEAHPIRICKYFRYLQISDRWKVAKKLGLCYRCLDNDNRHLGRYCPNTKVCRLRGCRLLHHRLLHDPNRRKLRAERYHTTNLIDQPSSEENDREMSEISTVESDVSGSVESDSTPQPSGGGESIVQNECDELNRLAMLAEMTVPFDLIFSGSCRNKSLQSRCVTPAPSGGEYSLDSVIDEHVDLEGQSSHLEDPSRHGDNIDSLDYFEETENQHMNTAIACDGNIDSEQVDEPQVAENNCAEFEAEDNANGPIDEPSDYSWITKRMENSGMFYNRRNHRTSVELQNINGTISEKISLDVKNNCENSEMEKYESVHSVYEQLTETPSSDNELDETYPDIAAPSSGQFDGEFDCTSSAEDNNENLKDFCDINVATAVAGLFQELGLTLPAEGLGIKMEPFSSFHETLNNEINRLDKEIASLSSTPAEGFLETENKIEMGLSTWLMPLPDSGGS